MVFGQARGPAHFPFPLHHRTSYLGPLLPSTLGSYQGLIAASSAICPPSAGCTARSEEIEERPGKNPRGPPPISRAWRSSPAAGENKQINKSAKVGQQGRLTPYKVTPAGTARNPFTTMRPRPGSRPRHAQKIQSRSETQADAHTHTRLQAGEHTKTNSVQSRLGSNGGQARAT